MTLLNKAGSVAVVCLLLIGSTSATGVSLGIKGGLNLARPWNLQRENSTLTMKPGLIMGAALGIPIVDLFSIQPEALYSSKGEKYVYTRTRFVYNFNYLEFPVLFKLTVPAGSVHPNVYAGPALAFLVSVSGYAAMDDKREDLSANVARAYKEQTSPVDFGLVMGGGLDIAAGSGQVTIDIRYTLGLVTLDIDGRAPDQNGALSVMGGFAFPLKGN